MNLKLERLHVIIEHVFNEVRYNKDTNRELPMSWSLMHMYTTMQLSVLTALKEGLNPELCGISAILHDIYTITTGKTKKHAKNASSLVYEIMNNYNNKWRNYLPAFTEKEIQIIHDSVINHSKKEVVSSDKYIETMKRIDSFDHYLHGLPVRKKEVKHLQYMFNLYNLDKKQK